MVNTVKSGVLLVEAVLATGFFSGKSCWGSLQKEALGSRVSPTVWLMLVVLAFPPCP